MYKIGALVHSHKFGLIYLLGVILHTRASCFPFVFLRHCALFASV